MSSVLRDWHTRLDKHFTELHRLRQEVHNFPIFALEHDLNNTELEQLATALRTHISKNPPSRDHALAWIVYATEMGYQYSGYEYWQSFESNTPGWIENGDRNWIRDEFQWFQEKFDGAQPSGSWAEHRTIICWPITHAILPQDLQQQLARLLYESRNLFSAEVLESPEALRKTYFRSKLERQFSVSEFCPANSIGRSDFSRSFTSGKTRKRKSDSSTNPRTDQQRFGANPQCT